MDDESKYGIEANDFVIRVRPFTDDEGEWNGQIDLALVTQPANDLSDDDYTSLMHFCKMMASTVPIMEVNEDIRELVHEYVLETFDKDYEPVLENKPAIIGQDGNVISIDFNTKTEGEA